MKKVIATLAAVLIGTLTLTAQDDVGVRFGLKLSPNMSFLKADTKNIKSNGAGIGYTFGLMLELPIGSSGNYRFATGLNLNNVTAKWKQEYTYADNLTDPVKTKDLEWAVKLQYVELPLTIKLMTNEIGYMRYFAVVGAGNAFNIRARADYVTPTVIANRPDGTEEGTPIVKEFTETTDEDLQSDIHLYKASLIVGAGFEYAFSGKTALMVGITYNNGFTNIVDIADTKAKGHYLELSVGVFF